MQRANRFPVGNRRLEQAPEKCMRGQMDERKVIRKDFQNEKMLQCADKWKSEKAIRKDFQSKLCQEIDFSLSPQIQECQESKLLPRFQLVTLYSRCQKCTLCRKELQNKKCHNARKNGCVEG